MKVFPSQPDEDKNELFLFARNHKYNIVYERVARNILVANSDF